MPSNVGYWGLETTLFRKVSLSFGCAWKKTIMFFGLQKLDQLSLTSEGTVQ